MRVQLMRADRIIVDIRRVLQVFPAKSLHPVRMEQRLRISGFYKRRNPFYVVFRPGLIVYVHNADKRGIFVHRPRDRFRRYHAVLVRLNECDAAAYALQKFKAFLYARMLRPGAHIMHIFFLLCAAQDDRIRALRSAACKKTFMALSAEGMQQGLFGPVDLFLHARCARIQRGRILPRLFGIGRINFL